jgi:hypothetical protein
MKKQFANYFFVLLSFLSIGFLGSCTSDEVTPTLSVELQEETGYISEDATLAPGSAFKIKWTATKGAKDMETFTVQEGNTNVSGFPKSLSGGDRDKFTSEVSLTSPNIEGDYLYKFTVTDKDGLTASQTVKITVAVVNSYTAVLLGNQINTTDPSFYATSTNTKYSVANAKTNSEKVDFGYGNGSASGNEYFIGAPNDPSITEVYSTGTWTTKNATKFVLTNLTAAQFDAINTPDAVIKAVTEGTAPSVVSRVRGAEIEANDVVGFTTAAGKKGLIKIVSRSGAANAAGSITINVKVQK